MNKSLLVAALFIAIPRLGWSQSDGPVFMGIDLYGTDRYMSDAAQQEFGDKIRFYADKHAKELRTKPKHPTSDGIRKQVEEIIRTTWGFAWVRLSWMDYYKKDSYTAYVTVDVVEPKDVKKRMPFRPNPTKTFPEANNLLDAWTQYTELGWVLVRRGEISADRMTCPAFYCTWGDQTPQLKELQERFIKAVPKNEKLLKMIMIDDRDPVHRANAAYLLSYMPNGSQLSFDLQAVLRDPDPEVRGAAMKIYSDLAVYHKDIYLPIDKFIEFLDYPTVEDRNKALDVLVALSDQPSYHDILVARASPILLKLLRLQQPANHDLAYAVLSIVSKENFDAKDMLAWQKWVRQARGALPNADLPQESSVSPAAAHAGR